MAAPSATVTSSGAVLREGRERDGEQTRDHNPRKS